MSFPRPNRHHEDFVQQNLRRNVLALGGDFALYMGKKLLFIGAGAIGSYLGAFLTRAGHDVTLVDPWSEQVEAIRQRGISVTGPHDPFEARPTAIHLHEAARLPRDFEIAFVAMAKGNAQKREIDMSV